MHTVARYGSLASSFVLLAMCLGALALNLTDTWHFTPGTAAPAVFCGCHGGAGRHWHRLHVPDCQLDSGEHRLRIMRGGALRRRRFAMAGEQP